MVVGLEAVAPETFAFGSCDGFAPPSFGAPGFEGLAVAVGVSDGRAVDSPCRPPSHRLYRSGPPHLSSAPAAVSRLCP
ncbi:hypothetical protein GCM10023238_08500 [Streptomyces heliomycini]